MPATFRFDAAWSLAAPADAVYRVLAEPDDYPRWWPQILSARRVDDDSGELLCRSRLPYTLRMVVRRELEDPVARSLRAGLQGDLVGWSSWQVEAADGGSGAVFRQEVSVAGQALRVAATIAPAVLRWNHRMMMTAGELGLRRYLATA